MGYLAPFSSLVGVSLIWDGLFVTTCEIEVLEYCGICEAKTSLSTGKWVRKQMDFPGT